MISSSITTNPRKRTISEASGGVALSHQEVTHDDESGVGLRRRRVESSSTAEMDDDKDKTKNKNNSLITTQQQEGGVGEQSHNNDHQQQQSVVPLSMQLMRPFWAISCCPDCPRSTASYNYNTRNSSASYSNQDFFTGKNNNNNLDHTLPTPTGPTRNISMAQIDDVERNERHRRAVGDMASIDAVRIAIGKKVFRDKCALAFQLGTNNPYIQFSFEHKGKLSEHRVYLKSGEVKEVRYHIPHEKETGEEKEIDSDSMTMIAFRISPNDKNNLEKYISSYNQEDSDDDPEKAHKRYISVEIRDTDEFHAMLNQMRQHSDLGIWCTKDSEIEFYDLDKYTKALVDDYKKEISERMSISRRTRNKDNNNNNNSPSSSYGNNSPSPLSEENESNNDPTNTNNTMPPSMALAITSSSNNNKNNHNHNDNVSIEQLLTEYTTACTIYGCLSRINPGILTTLRFQLPTLRVSGNFFDADMLALSELLIKYCNTSLSYIKRLDFTIAGKEGKDKGGAYGSGSGKKGIRSHGAYALSKVLCMSKHIEEVYLTGNKMIGQYGASAIFTAAAQNRTLTTLHMRGCRIRERGAVMFARTVLSSNSVSGLKEIDLSACRIGFGGCYVIEEALKNKQNMEVCYDANHALIQRDTATSMMMIDLEGNLIFQEVMNCVTHGLGILLGTVGTFLLTKQVKNLPSYYIISCAIYSASVILLYTSSTLFHSFFALKKTKFIFKVFDRCAIYLLIAGSYTPFLMIALHHEPKWSLHLLLFIWACAISGILVEAFFMTWKHKSKFSLSMYLGMGWSTLACVTDMMEVLPNNALALIFAGGVAYTAGVPFFVRNNNLDHSIWHLFVLAGSIFHWLSIYWYVAIPK